MFGEVFNDSKAVIQFIKSNKVSTLSDFRPSDFAQENGAAYIVAKNDVKTVAQLRKFFSEIKRLEKNISKEPNDRYLDDLENFKQEVILLLPELAYALGRKLIEPDFYELMKVCLGENKLKTVGDFRRLAQFLTAVVAYHKMQNR